MPSKVLISSAGSGKTTFIVDAALASAKRVLILTYTNENLGEIKKRFTEKYGLMPSHVKVQSWYTFLLKEAVRPFQNYLYNGARVSTLNFEEPPENLRYIPETDTKNYYFTKTGKIYRDRVSNFAYKCNEKSCGLTIERLEMMYDEIYIDEIQDMAGWDLEFLDLLMQSNISLTFVGDIRQATYSTNNSTKNKQYKGAGILKWFELKQKNGLCAIEYKAESYRCNQVICDFADNLYPGLASTSSKNGDRTGHDGLFYLKNTDVANYVAKYSPRVLRSDKTVETASNNPINFGQSKGQTYDRVLIYPTKTIIAYLKNGKLQKVKNGKMVSAFDIPKFYVAVTRARFSVAIVMNDRPFFEGLVQFNSHERPAQFFNP